MTGCTTCDFYVVTHSWQALVWHLATIHGLGQDDASTVAHALSRGYWVRYTLGPNRKIVGWSEAWTPPEIARRAP